MSENKKEKVKEEAVIAAIANSVKESGATKVELIIREGEALGEKEEQKLTVNANIEAPRKFAEVRGVYTQKCLVVFSKAEMGLTYYEDHKNYYGSQIIGSLLISPNINKFGINSGKLYHTEDLAKLFKMNKHLFADRSEADKLIIALTTCKVKVQNSIDKDSDNRGNKKIHFDKVVESEIPHSFKMKSNIFVGFPPIEFNVDINFDTSEMNIRVWLESSELNLLIEEEGAAIIDKELDFFREKGVACLEE